MRAFFLSLISHICVTLIFTTFVVGILIYFFDYTFSETGFYMSPYEQPYLITLSFAFIYGLLQYVFFVAIKRFYRISCKKILVVILLSNVLSGLIAPLLIRLSVKPNEKKGARCFQFIDCFFYVPLFL